MSDTAYYTDHYTYDDNSYIRQSWYNAHTETLYVEFYDGSLLGHIKFPAPIFYRLPESRIIRTLYNTNVRKAGSPFVVDQDTTFVFIEAENLIETAHAIEYAAGIIRGAAKKIVKQARHVTSLADFDGELDDIRQEYEKLLELWNALSEYTSSIKQEPR